MQSSGATWTVNLRPLQFFALGVDGLEPWGASLQKRRIVGLHPDGGMGADEGALAALDADVRLPDRDMDGDVPLLVLGGPGRPGAVRRAWRTQGGWSPLSGDHLGASRSSRNPARPREPVGCIGFALVAVSGTGTSTMF